MKKIIYITCCFVFTGVCDPDSDSQRLFMGNSDQPVSMYKNNASNIGENGLKRAERIHEDSKRRKTTTKILRSDADYDEERKYTKSLYNWLKEVNGIYPGLI